MGLLNWFFPSPETRLAKGRDHLDNGRFVQAREELMGVDLPEAIEALAQAENGLVLMNLDHALSWAESGDTHRVETLMELATNLHHGGLEDAFRETRRKIREVRAAAKAEAEAKTEASDQRAMDAEGQGFLRRRHAVDVLLPDDLGDDVDEMRARLALLVERYPEPLRASVEDLGPDFAHAVLDLEDGRADLALPKLMAQPDDQPLVRWERARNAYALNDPRAAARELKALGELAGHHQFGSQHSGEFYALCLAESGQPKQALTVLAEVRRATPGVGGYLYAQLLVGAGELESAESVLRSLIRNSPKQTAFYKLLADVRIRGDHRVEAMRVLEQALQATHCAPGTCGFQPPDPAVKLMLATLYLEDGIETDRAHVLLSEVPRGDQALWQLDYADALAAKHDGSPEALQLAAAAWAPVEGGDGRRAQLEKYLPLPA